MKPHTVFVAVVLTLLTASLGWGQDGVITGRVSDPTDAVLPGVGIVLTSSQVMGERTQISDERGTYRFTLLPPGTYTVKFELPSFKTLVREGIQLSVGFTATINATLEVAGQGETITVAGESPVIDVERATVGTTFNSNLLANLPLTNNYYEVFSITPGVQVTVPDVGGSRVHQQQGIRTYGTSGQYNIAIDGIVTTQETNNMSMYYDNNSMQEFNIVEVSKSAEIPTAGLAVNLVVKTGSNKVHGSLNTDYTGPGLQFDNLTDAYRAKGITFNKWDHYHDTYFDAGGPFKKDKFWWYAAYKQLDLGIQQLGFKKDNDVWIQDCDIHGNCKTVPAQGVDAPAIYTTRNRNLTSKFTYQLSKNNTMSYTGLLFDKFDPQRGSDSVGRFITDNNTGILYKPIWAQTLHITTVLSQRMTLESSVNLHRDGPRHEYAKNKNYLTERDLDTQQRRGAYDTTGVHQTQYFLRFHADETLGMTTHGLGGNHNIRMGFEWRYESGRVYNDPRSYNLRTEWRGGFKTPAFIYTFDTPFYTDDRLKHQSAFFNDTWNVTRRLTLNLGFRYDRRTPFRPEQGKTGAYPYQDQFTVPAETFQSFNNPVGRLSVVYDVFGNTKTVLKFSYGGYSYEPHIGISSGVNPTAVTVKRYMWDGTLPAGWVQDTNGMYRFTGWPCGGCATSVVPFVPDPSKLVSVTGGRNTSIDPNLKLGRADEYMVDLDQQVARDTSVRFTAVRKRTSSVLQVFNRAIPFSAYSIPVSVSDPGRDGVSGTSDDQKLTVWSVDRSYIGATDYVQRNQPGRVDNFLQYSLNVVRRFSSKWQANSGLDILHYKFGADFDNPNTALNASYSYWAWQYKVAGTYQLPKGVNFSSSLRYLKGQPRSRTINSPSLNQGVITVTAEPLGSRFYPNYALWDVQLGKDIRLGERWGTFKTELTLSNIFNNNSILTASNLTGLTYDQVNSIVDPRVFRVNLGWRF